MFRVAITRCIQLFRIFYVRSQTASEGVPVFQRFQIAAILLLIYFSLSGTTLWAQERYSNIRIYIPEEPSKRLELLGLLEVDHFHEEDGSFMYTVSEQQLKMLGTTSFAFDMVDEDAVAALVKQNNAYYQSLKNSGPAARVGFERTNDVVGNIITTPSAFVVQPTLGGYYRFGQMDTAMSALVSAYPAIAQKFSIGTSVEGREMWCIKISDNVSTDESGEPEALFMGLHHAREAIGGASMIFLMQYLCENYTTDSRIKDLVDNREIYIIPCVNPDGWEYNRSTNPNGGGQWRKNRKNNGDGSYGADLNRNWPVDWGNCTGAIGAVNCGSSTGSSEVYWGASQLSEPESMNLYDFVRARDFVVVMDQHATGPYYSLPYGRIDTLLSAQDDSIFIQMCAAMGKYNGMRYGSTYQTLGYEVSGGMKDWLLRGDVATIGKVYGMTGEGSNGSSSTSFWPVAADIITLCKGMVYQDLQMLYMAGSYVDFQDVGSLNLTSTTGNFSFSVRRIGLGNDSVTISVIPIQNVASVGSPVTIAASSLPNYNSSYSGTISYALSGGISAQTNVKFAWKIQTGGYTYYDTVSNIYQAVSLFTDGMESGSVGTRWTVTGGGWAYTNDKAYNGSRSLAESPSANYPSSTIRTIQKSSNLDLTGSGAAYLSFYVRYRSENFRDKLKVQVSTDGSTWTTISGRNTVREPGTSDGSKIADTASLTGIRIFWTREVFDLSNFVSSNNLRLRFQFTSDNSSTYTYAADEGFNIDDVVILTGAAPTSLPVELTAFTGRTDGSVNILNWHTASEFNTTHFIIQRSATGLGFEDIGEMPANGNSRAPLFYEFTDPNPFAGDNLYRLKIVDADGTFEYSKMILLQTAESDGRIPSGIRSVYPNPTNGQATINFYEGQDAADYVYRIYSVIGQLMQEEQLTLDKGEHALPLDAQDFPAGQYIIQFHHPGKGISYEEKFIKR
jgi:carboxypeptidase T